jgi:ArsR family transcriptional regulator
MKRAELCCAPAPKNEGKGLKVALDDRALATMAKALGHPARVRILRYLARVQGCICGEIVKEVGLAQATVSQHLKVLKSAGLIQGTLSGPSTCYCLEPLAFARLKSQLDELT